MQRFLTVAGVRRQASQWAGSVGVLLLLSCAFQTSAAWAVTSLKQVQISNGSRIDLLFDGKIQKGQIHTEFFNDIIQLSISDVSVYPAKISAVNGGSLTKIFAYQYAPKLVRCRLTVNGKAESFKDKFEVKAGGKILSIRMDEPSKEAVATAQAVANKDAVEERALLSRVLANEPAAAPAAKDTISTSAAAPVAAAAGKAAVTIQSTENLPIKGTGPKLGGAKAMPSPLKAFGKMALVLALFGALAYGFKKFAQGRAEARGALGAISRFAKKNLGRSGKMIEVLSNHHLGPKKSISVVRVGGRVLVLGISSESINLITQLSGEEADPMGLGESDLASSSQVLEGLGLGGVEAPSKKPTNDPIFADLLNAERSKPVVPGTSATSPSSVRAQIRNRLDGYKSL